MTKPRPPRHAAPHPDDARWSPRDLARLHRRLFNKLAEFDPPEVQAEYRREQAAKRAVKPD